MARPGSNPAIYSVDDPIDHFIVVCLVSFGCVKTSPISFVARGKGTRASKEIGDVCTQAKYLTL